MGGTMTESDPVLCAIDRRGIATLTLNRPQVGNAYDGDLIAALADTLARLASAEGLRAVLLRGAGRTFQAGADLSFLDRLRAASPKENLDFSRRTQGAIDALERFPHPTLALVHGGCFGGGIGLCAACDIAIAAEDAVFAVSEVRWGITPAPIIPLLVTRIGARALSRYALSGERFGAAEALAIGLVHEIAPAAGLEASAERILDSLMRAAPEAAAMTKQLIAEALAAADTPATRERLAVEAASRRLLAEAREGFESFARKRAPAWCPTDGKRESPRRRQ
jgi:methylglutaconyl-CoA hydratase